MISVLLCTFFLTIAFSVPITIHDTDTTATPVDLLLTSCLQNKYNAAGNSGSLGCTANDVQIIIMKLLDPFVGGYCFNNEVFTFDAIVNFQVTANTRYDPGVFFSYSDANALTGTCSATYLDKDWTEERAVGVYNKETNKGNDDCGDVTSSNDVVVLMRIQTKCMNSNSNTSFADIQYCTTWHHNAAGDCFDVDDLWPTAGSKCFCGAYNDLFRICERCTITPNYQEVTRPCDADANEFAAQVGDFSFSAGCQSSTISYTDTSTGSCSVSRVASAQDSCGNVVTSAPQAVITVTDPPVVTCPEGAAATIDCGVPTVDLSTGIDTVATSGNSTYNKVDVVYRVEDQCENHVHVTCTLVCADYSYVAE